MTALLHRIETPLLPPRRYAQWRERKLARCPRRAEELLVEVRDPRRLSESEARQLQRVCARANMAIYASPLGETEDKDLVRHLGERLGLGRAQSNPLADEDGVSALETVSDKAARGYIPYSNRRLLWHTDGYYNAPAERIRSFILHCVRPAASGGENRLLDPEIAYLLLRDENPAWAEALCAPDAMTVPPNEDAAVGVRGARGGPVFSFDGAHLHMRYTARTRSIAWRADETTSAAREALVRLLESASPYVFRVRLEAGQGLVCNNVLHDRSAFTDDPMPGRGRLVYRARYARRIAPE